MRASRPTSSAQSQTSGGLLSGFVTANGGYVLAWNPSATIVYGDFGGMHGLERHMLHLMFLNPSIRRVLVDWPLVARGIVAKVRSIYAWYVDDPWSHVDLLRARRPEFASWWKDHEVHPHQDGVKSFEHQDALGLTFDFFGARRAG